VQWETPTAMLSTGDMFDRGYLYIETLPSGGTGKSGICQFGGTLALNGDGTVDVYDGASNLVSAAVTTLSTGQWYRIEAKYNTTSGLQEFRVEGSTVYTVASAFGSQTAAIGVGGNMQSGFFNATSGTWYWDDIGQNDAAGSSQNSWCGEGKIGYLFLDGDGDASEGTPLRGGADSGADWSQMDENPPNDATDYMNLDANPGSVWGTVPAGSTIGIGASDTITLVEVHGRIRGATSNPTNWFPQIQKVTAGTVVSATAVVIESTTWFHNDDTAAARECKLVRYTDPDGAAWTPSTIDTMQISGKGTDGNPDLWLTALWAIVEFVPAAVTAGPFPYAFQGVKKNRVLSERKHYLN
jgi:hypothetical protein